LLISVPGGKSTGASTPAITELIDLYPTLADLCGLKAPAGLDGVSLRPQLDDPRLPGKQAAITQVRRGGGANNPAFAGYSIRTDRYRYTAWAGGAKGSELYDHEKDPREFTNVAGVAEYAETARELQKLLEERMTQ
jgi:uncharacterized sulfatase